MPLLGAEGACAARACAVAPPLHHRGHADANAPHVAAHARRTTAGVGAPPLRIPLMRRNQGLGRGGLPGGLCEGASIASAPLALSHQQQHRGNLRCRAEAGAAGTTAPNTQRLVGRGCRVIGTGSATPSMLVSNEYLASIVDTNSEWITTRTGISNRRVLSGEETMTQLSAEAGRQALLMAGVEAKDVDLILLCTSSPEDIFGGACMVQRDLGCTNAVSFDLTAACSGFVLGLVTASRFILGGGFKNVLVIGADTLSRYVDWTDRATCILFGDGCGAIVVQACAEGESSSLLGFDMKSDGQGARHLNACVSSNTPAGPPTHVPQGTPALGGPSFPTPGPGLPLGAQALAAAPVAVAERGEVSTPGSDTEAGAPHALNGAAAGDGPAVVLPGLARPTPITMNGREVYKFAVTSVPQVLRSALNEAGLSGADVDWLVLHQANQRILDAVAQKLDIPSSKVVSNVAKYGNTSAASIPLALDEAVRSGSVKKGDVLAMAGFGAGLTWAGAIIRFG